jgi:hypothetical protein
MAEGETQDIRSRCGDAFTVTSTLLPEKWVRSTLGGESDHPSQQSLCYGHQWVHSRSPVAIQQGPPIIATLLLQTLRWVEDNTRSFQCPRDLSKWRQQDRRGPARPDPRPCSRLWLERQLSQILFCATSLTRFYIEAPKIIRTIKKTF